MESETEFQKDISGDKLGEVDNFSPEGLSAVDLKGSSIYPRSSFFFSSYSDHEVLSSRTEPSGKITEQDLSYIARELGLIRLCWEDVQPVNYDLRINRPLSYSTNSEKEKIFLWYAENFRRQYTYKFPNRRPLLLACDNECGIQKMVCTTIRPTTMRYAEFQTWQGCSNFVSDYLNYQCLASPTVLPDRINSPKEVLNRQAGHSFEYSTLLASLLIGSGYDAYVVSGYATREACLADQSLIECPFLVDETEEEQPEEKEVELKYALKKPNELRSKFFLKMDARRVQREKDALKAQELAELAAIKELEKPLPDELWTWRLHSWVLVLPSKDVLEPFFIESSTGCGKAVDDPQYHGIESVWNHLNYWVLVQFERKTESCQDINFDLSDVGCWEHLLVGEPITGRILPKDLEGAEEEDVDRIRVEAEKHLDQPASWVEMLQLTNSEYEIRYPNLKKTTNYRKCISEKFAPYTHSDGLLQRVTRFDDYEWQDPRDIRETYGNRVDLMFFSRKLIKEFSVVQKFRRGRDDALKEHFFYETDVGIEVSFRMEFYDEARIDGLSKLDMDPKFMVESFAKRTDYLYFRRVDFAPRTDFQAPYREILKITEKYHRNPEVEASLDPAIVEFCFPERNVQIRFHYEYQHVTQGHRAFVKPSKTEMGESLVFDPDLTSGYLTGPTVPQPKPLYLYRLQTKYLEMEGASVAKVRDRENELLQMLRTRTQELAMPRLYASEFDMERNAEAREGYKLRERQAEEARRRDLDLKYDFLSPYYAKLGEPNDKRLGAKEARKVWEECLQDWKNLLVDRANDMQQQFEETSQNLQERNNWYERNQKSLTKEQEEEYFDYCKRKSLDLHSLEVRLARHKELAPQKYLAIEAYLRTDPRLVAARPKKKQM